MDHVGIPAYFAPRTAVRRCGVCLVAGRWPRCSVRRGDLDLDVDARLGEAPRLCAVKLSATRRPLLAGFSFQPDPMGAWAIGGSPGCEDRDLAGHGSKANKDGGLWPDGEDCGARVIYKASCCPSINRMEDAAWHPWRLGLVRPSLDALPQEDREAVLDAIEALRVDPYNPPGHQVRPLRGLKRRQRWLLTLPGGVCIQYEPIPAGLPPALMRKTILFWSISTLQSIDPTSRADGQNEETKLEYPRSSRSLDRTA